MTRGPQLGDHDEKLAGGGKSETDFPRGFVDREAFGLLFAQDLEPSDPRMRHFRHGSASSVRGGVDAQPAGGQRRLTLFHRIPISGGFASTQIRKHAGIRFAAREHSGILLRVNRLDAESVGRLGREVPQRLALQRRFRRRFPLGQGGCRKFREVELFGKEDAHPAISSTSTRCFCPSTCIT